MTEPDGPGTTGPDDDRSHSGRSDAEADVASAASDTSGPATVAMAVEGAPRSDYLHDSDADDLGTPGQPFNIRSPFLWGLKVGFGALLAWWLVQRIEQIGSVLLLIVVSLFLAVGLNPMVEKLMRRGLKRPWAVLIVIVGVVAAVIVFIWSIAPIVTDQITAITDNAPVWIDNLQHNATVQSLDDKYDVLDRIKSFLVNGDLIKNLFGGVLGIGKAVLGFFGNAFVVTVMTLYFLASLPRTKQGLYRLAPASRRTRVSLLGDRVLRNIGGYVSGAFVVASAAGTSTLIFLFIVGLGDYAVALALVVALLDVIPMIGATLGAVVVCAIGFATDWKVGIALVIFYIVYQQLENYVIYPRVMSRSVDIPGVVTVIAALVGASLLGVIGALLAIPTAASILLIINEVVLPRQEQR